LNPHAFRHRNLNPARLPISTIPQTEVTADQPLQERLL
jgi:hypothetical protein